MFDLSLQQLLLRIVAIIIVTGLAGFLLALFARLLGDRGPVHDGKLNPNPFTHLDLLAIVAGILAQTGWVRPVVTDASEIKGRSAGVFVAVLAALITLVALAWLLWSFRSVLLAIVPDASFATSLIVALRIGVETALGFAVLNLIPLPPLAMGQVLAGLAPSLHARVTRYDLVIRIALVVILALGYVAGPFRAVLAPLRAMVGL